jgi:N-acyl-L-homoserine lactone synthetase
MAVSRPAPGIAALDQLSERLLAAAPALRVELTETALEREASYRLRHEQVVGDGWARRDQLPTGLEEDPYDDAALHIGAWSDRALAGTLRLVLPQPPRRLPVEAAFDIDIEPYGAVVEAGRLVVAPAQRGDPAHGIWGALFARAWLTMRERGFTVLAGAATPRMVERLRGLGLPFEVLGAARPYWGEPRHPVRLDPAHGDPRWYER